MDFFSVTVSPANLTSKNKIQKSRLELSNYHFNSWMERSIGKLSPIAEIIPLEKTIAWFLKINNKVTQKAENPTQKSLFGIYNIAKGTNGISIAVVLWLFNSLEALLSTRPGENISGILKRTAIILNFDEKQRGYFEKKIKYLYNLRSSFVHGGYEVTHPLEDERIDSRVEEDYINLIDYNNYVFSVLGAILQKMIIMNIEKLEFKETLIISNSN